LENTERHTSGITITAFSLNFDEGYQDFKVGLLLKEARESASITMMM